ncbi:SRPBCC family protein [Clostridium intestinale]|uniref:Activator of Hsp90 ATPase 1 family protein n=1 Tax=Clostridium intestinale URNW TaxID=1294142 RepID=U2Q4V9_9CLOT|nr:SRPBCC family protein [Clostridium intestinale]ERK31144.1 Activator of Hsp90 ATPase 1 family protein [Clostridium intestinale URNW]
MRNSKFEKITIETTINTPVAHVWKFWTEPVHIMKWNSASDDWHTPFAENDLRIGGKFLSRMEAKDGSFGFDFGGTYADVKANEIIAYTLEDGRNVYITFLSDNGKTKIVEVFDAEETNPVEFQEQGWKAILDNFKGYVEKNFKA